MSSQYELCHDFLSARSSLHGSSFLLLPCLLVGMVCLGTPLFCYGEFPLGKFGPIGCAFMFSRMYSIDSLDS